MNDAHRRVPLQNATQDQSRAGHHVAHNEGRRADALSPCAKVIARCVQRRDGGQVNRQRDVKVGDRRPQWIITGVPDRWAILHRLRVDLDPLESKFRDTAAGFLDSSNRVSQIHGTHAHKASVPVSEKIIQPGVMTCGSGRQPAPDRDRLRN